MADWIWDLEPFYPEGNQAVLMVDLEIDVLPDSLSIKKINPLEGQDEFLYGFFLAKDGIHRLGQEMLYPGGNNRRVIERRLDSSSHLKCMIRFCLAERPFDPASKDLLMASLTP